MMDVSELRKRILRAIDEARQEAASRRIVVDASAQAYQAFLAGIAVPLLRQAAQVLNAAGHTFIVHTPADSARLAAEKSPETFVEVELDSNRPEPQVIGRVSITRGRHGLVIEERPIADKTIAALTEDDLSAFLVMEVPKLVVKR